MTQSTSFFSVPEDHLDPVLFDGDTVREAIRLDILSILRKYFTKHDLAPKTWMRAWIAGSGASYQWSAARTPGDLDVLVGVDYVQFRKYNSAWDGLSDDEIAAGLNEMLWAELVPQYSDYLGQYEMTFYVNPDGTDIRNLKPYAAYDLINNTWTVHPVSESHQHNPQWDMQVAADHKRAASIVQRYAKYLTEMHNAVNPAYRTNAERSLSLVMDDASDLYEDIHQGRREAFSRVGGGYTDYGNYRWQAGKATGAVQALKEIKQYRDEQLQARELTTYGIDLPDADTLVRRAALQHMTFAVD